MLDVQIQREPVHTYMDSIASSVGAPNVPALPTYLRPLTQLINALPVSTIRAIY